MRFTLRQMQVFVEVARSENVSRAAEALSLSQSAASAALAELESQFERQLFERHGKRLRLNEYGSLLLPHAVELLDRAAEIEGLLRGERGLGSLRVGATLTIGNYLLPIIVSNFLQAHPESRVRLQVRNTATIAAMLLHHEIDLGLVEGGERARARGGDLDRGRAGRFLRARPSARGARQRRLWRDCRPAVDSA